MKKTASLIEKIIPKNTVFLLIFCLLSQLAVYYGGMFLSRFFTPQCWEIEIDSYFHVSPLWAIVYFASYILWFVNYILICRSSESSAVRLVAADTVSKLISLIFFVFLPTTITRPDLSGLGANAFLLRFIYGVDLPINLFPSLHCLISWLCTRPLFDIKTIKPWYRYFSLIFSVLIFLSTLYTKQHVFVDVIGGVLIAELCYDFVRYTKLEDFIKEVNRKAVKRFIK